MFPNLLRGAASGVAVLAACLVVEPAHAEPAAPLRAPGARSQADELFQRGRALLRDGRVAEACAVLEESQRLDPAGGTLLNLSRCYEGLGRFATADAVLARALEAAIARGREDAIAFVRGEQARLAPRIDRVRLALPPLPADAMVRLDARVLGAADRTRPIPVDPGAHEVVVIARGHATSRTAFQIVATPYTGGRMVEVRVAPLAAEPRTKTPRDGTADSRDAMVTTGGVSLATGSLALVIGAALGIASIVEWNDVEERCPSNPCDDEVARSDARSAQTMADVSTGLFVGGLSAAGIGITLLVTAPAPVSGDAGQARVVVQGTLP